ncbi:MAG: hypothetical protein ACP5I8_06940 [Phycisphaerae bacterium]
MVERLVLKVKNWLDPIAQEGLEDMGFFREGSRNSNWICYGDAEKVQPIASWLKKRNIAFQVQPADGIGELKKYPRLSDQLVDKTGGGPTHCALCGASNVFCRQWIEGDDADNIDYPAPMRFYMCGKCVRTRMQPHPRLYAPAEDSL